MFYKYVDEAKPLVSKRQPKQRKEEPTQGDTFAASKPSTQHENPDYKKENEKDADGSTNGVGTVEEKKSATITPPESTQPPELPPRDNTTSDQVGG